MDAARELFLTQGYARVTVSEIAKQAGIAVKTVYTSAGSKADILRELLATAVNSSGAEETLAEVRRTTDPTAAIRVLAHGTRMGNEHHRDAIEMMYAAMPVHDSAEDVWEQGTALYRKVLCEVASHLDAIGGLAAGIGTDRAADILWFCFGTSAWRTLTKDCGWTWDASETWLATQATALLTTSRYPETEDR